MKKIIFSVLLIIFACAPTCGVPREVTVTNHFYQGKNWHLSYKEEKNPKKIRIILVNKQYKYTYMYGTINKGLAAFRASIKVANSENGKLSSRTLNALGKGSFALSALPVAHQN